MPEREDGEWVTSSIRMPRKDRDQIGQMIKIAHELGVIEKPTLGDLIQHGLALVHEGCYRLYTQIRDKGER